MIKWYSTTTEPKLGETITVATLSGNVYSFEYQLFNENDVAWCYTKDLMKSIPRPHPETDVDLFAIGYLLALSGILLTVGVFINGGVFY